MSTFRTSTIKQLVRLSDPKPERDIIYRFSGGRIFRENHRPPGYEYADAGGGSAVTFGGEEAVFGGEETEW